MTKYIGKLHKIVKEIGIILSLVSLTIYLYVAGILLNPFYVIEPETKEQIEQEFGQGTDYITLSNVDLEFTGYYKLDSNGEALYYCYSTDISGTKFFVFVPPVMSDKDDDPPQTLTGYSCTANMHEDEELFKTAALDYSLTSSEFEKKYDVSLVVLDEIRNNRTEMIATWVLLGLAYFLCLGYVLIPLLKKEERIKEKQIKINA